MPPRKRGSQGGALRNVDGDEPIFMLRDDRSDSVKESERRRAAINAVECGMRVGASREEIEQVLKLLGLKDYTPPPRKKRKK